MQQYLNETPLLNFSASNIQSLIMERNWKELDEYERTKAIYEFVRDEIRFGYNIWTMQYKRNSVYGTAPRSAYPLQNSWFYN